MTSLFCQPRALAHPLRAVLGVEEADVVFNRADASSRSYEYYKYTNYYQSQ